MGVDFIDRTKGGIKKGWDRAKRKLSEDDLFSCPPEKIRTITFEPKSERAINSDENLLLREEGGKIFVHLNRSLIGVCENPPASIKNKLSEAGGVGIGKFYQRREISGLIDVAVYIATPAKELEQ